MPIPNSFSIVHSNQELTSNSPFDSQTKKVYIRRYSIISLRFNNPERLGSFDGYQTHPTMDHPVHIKPFNNFLSQETLRTLQAAITGEETQEGPGRAETTPQKEHSFAVPEREADDAGHEEAGQGALTPQFN
jgi:hypothetical protein